MFAFFFAAATAYAGPQVVVNLDADTIQSLGTDPAEFESTLRGQIEDRLQLDADPALMERLARANAMSVRGLGVDYASNPKMFAFGMSVGTAVNESGFSVFSRDDSLLPSNGFSAQAGIMAGVNLGAFSPGDDKVIDRFMVYTNAMRVAREIGDYQATIWTWGLHGQYALVQPVSAGIATWGGVDLTTGFDLASYSVALSQGTPIDGGIGTWNATGTYEVSAKATTIPVEVSTSGSIPGMSLWIGVAGDLAPGARSERTVSLDGDIAADDMPNTNLGTVNASLTERVDVQPIAARFFTGFQFDITAVKLYTQVNFATDKSIGMHAGLRAAL